LASIVEPNFTWANFTYAMYVNDKGSQAVAKASKDTKTDTAAPHTFTLPISSTIFFLTYVLTVDAKRQVLGVKPGTTVRANPGSWKKISDPQDLVIFNQARKKSS
jgi:hypothetical protein